MQLNKRGYCGKAAECHLKAPSQAPAGPKSKRHIRRGHGEAVTISQHSQACNATTVSSHMQPPFVSPSIHPAQCGHDFTVPVLEK
jgi:hypothetical protein